MALITITPFGGNHMKKILGITSLYGTFTQNFDDSGDVSKNDLADALL